MRLLSYAPWYRYESYAIHKGYLCAGGNSVAYNILEKHQEERAQEPRNRGIYLEFASLKEPAEIVQFAAKWGGLTRNREEPLDKWESAINLIQSALIFLQTEFVRVESGMGEYQENALPGALYSALPVGLNILNGLSRARRTVRVIESKLVWVWEYESLLDAIAGLLLDDLPTFRHGIARCENCGVFFIPTRPWSKFCSLACKDACLHRRAYAFSRGRRG